MTEYKVINYKSETEFEAAMTQYIADGWTPVGGVCAYVTEQSQVHFCQAITRTV